MSFDSGGGGTAVQRVEPNQAAQPLYERLLREGEALYNSGGPNYFPNQTVAPFSPETEDAFAMQTARATNGSPLNTAAGGYIQDVLGGRYMDQEAPGLQNVLDRVTQQVNSQFGSRAMSGAHATALGDAIAPILYQNYYNELNRMGDAASMAPTIAAEDYRDIAALRDVGQQRELKGQAYIDDAIRRWEFEQNKPFDKIEFLKSLVWGDPFTTQISKGGGAGGSQWGNMLGGLAGGVAQGLIGGWA